MPNLWMKRYNLQERLRGLRYLFRVDHEYSSTQYEPSRGFVASRCLKLWGDEIDVLDHTLALVDDIVRNHVMARPTRTPWISTTESWLMAVWHATILMQRGYKGVHLSVISVNGGGDLSHQVESERKFYSIDLLRRNKPLALSVNDLTVEERWASLFQQILVFGHLPSRAVISRIPVERLIPSLPDNFFHRDAARTVQNLIWLDLPSPELQAPTVISVGSSAHTHSDEEIGYASAKLAITTLHVPLCSVRPYRDSIISLAREIAHSFTSSRPSPDTWEGLRLGIDRHIAEQHDEFVSGIQRFVMDELAHAQQAMEDVSLLVKGTISASFRGKSPRGREREETSRADPEQNIEYLQRLAGIIESTRTFESCIRAARRVLGLLVPENEEEQLAKDVMLASLGALSGRMARGEGEGD